jgi:hypothetical protein
MSAGLTNHPQCADLTFGMPWVHRPPIRRKKGK